MRNEILTVGKVMGISGLTIIQNLEWSVPILNFSISILTVTWLVLRIRNEKKVK